MGEIVALFVFDNPAGISRSQSSRMVTAEFYRWSSNHAASVEIVQVKFAVETMDTHQVSYDIPQHHQ